jgi:UDP-N-acetylmuramoylalanine--D-glutamate ligase
MSEQFKGKKVLLFGAQKTGLSLARFFHKAGAEVIVSDLKSREQLGPQGDAFEEFDVQWELGSNAPKSLTLVDLIVLSPGMNPHDKSLEPAKQKGIQITGEIELASTLIRDPIIAITGTNGKSTATKLVHDFLVASEVNTWIGGNYGTPLIDYLEAKTPAAALAVEVSSFQLETIDTFRPRHIIFLNLAEDHLDRYKSMNEYINAKKRIFRNSSPETVAILNADDPFIVDMARDPQVLRNKVRYFTRRPALEEQIKKIGGAVYSNKEIRVHVNGQSHTYSTARMKVKGKHNIENMMASILAVYDYGAKPEAIQTVIDTFTGLEHRLEFVRRKGGVDFYNDSKSTNVHSLIKALEAFDEPIILIAGGKDKGMDFTPLVDPVHDKVKNLILVGEAKERLNRSIGDFSETFIIGTFEESVLVAFQKSRSGDVVLLSPGCSSYDLFKNYEERGNYFKELVKKL